MKLRAMLDRVICRNQMVGGASRRLFLLFRAQIVVVVLLVLRQMLIRI